MKHFVIASLALVLAGPAFAQSAAEKTGVNSLMGVAPKTEDFVKEAATSDMFEIASSKLALERGDEATKAFAQQMLTDHQKTTDELKGLVTSGKVKAPLPAAMTSSQQSMLDKLNGLQGADFNKAYIEAVVDGHRKAVALFTKESESGNNAQLKSAATKALPIIQHHYEMAQQLAKGKS